MRRLMILLLAKYYWDRQTERRHWRCPHHELERREMFSAFSWAHLKKESYLKVTDQVES